MPPLSVLLAARRPSAARSLRRLLEDHDGFAVVLAPANVEGVIRTVHEHRPDVVVLDLPLDGLPSLAAILRVRRRAPAVPMIVLGAARSAALVDRALAAGATCFVLTGHAEAELTRAVQDAAQGRRFVSAALAPALDALRRSLSAPDLEERETEVLRLVALGHTSAEMAKRLLVSRRTIDSERARIHGKLGLRTRAELVQFALARGLIGR